LSLTSKGLSCVDSLACFVLNQGRFPFDQKLRCEISKISPAKWNSKSGNVWLATPARLNQTVPFGFGRKFPEIYDRGTGNRNFFEWNSIFRSFRFSGTLGEPRKVYPIIPEICSRKFPFHSTPLPEFPEFLV